MNRRTKLYLLIAFAFTWCGWIASYVLSHLRGSLLSTNGTIFSLWTSAWGSERFLPQLVFTLAVYGPLLGFLAAGNLKMLFKSAEGKKSFWLYILFIPAVSVLPSLILSIFASDFNPKGSTFATLLTSIFLYFISNLITSGTEEFGWRGFLYPAMKARGMSFWSVAWKGGLLWAVWHYPLLVIMYMPLGLAVLIPSLAGFTASIVAMNYISNFLYEKTRNILAVVTLHALNNTMSFVVILLFPGTPFTILSNLMAWAIVWYIEKKFPKETAL